MKNTIKLGLMAMPLLLASCGGSGSLKLREGNEMTLTFISILDPMYSRTDITLEFPNTFPYSEKDKYKVTNDIKDKSSIKETNINKSNINEFSFVAHDFVKSSTGESEEVYGCQIIAQLKVESGKLDSGSYLKFDYNPKLEKEGKVVSEGKMTITLKVA